MRKPRIVIRAFTCRRDVASAELLARILRRFNCDVLVTAVRDFERTLRLWKPHIAIVNTPGQSLRVKTVAPHVATVWLDGEGFRPDFSSHAQTLSKRIDLFQAADLILFWGKAVRDELQETLAGEDLSKVHVVGYPKLDLVRYLPERMNMSRQSRSVGFVTRFHNLNDFLGHMVIRRVLNPGNLDRVQIQLQYFSSMLKAIKEILRKTDLKVEIRPHPSEQVESYRAYIPEWFGAHAQRVTVDHSIDFASWAARQRVLVSPSSTSFLEAYLLGIPVVNLDQIAGVYEYHRNYAPVVGGWQSAAVMPDTLDELCKMVDAGLPPPARSDEIEKQLIDYCDFDSDVSSCYRIARLTVEHFQKTTFWPRVHWPRSIVDLRDRVSFWRQMRRNPLHQNFSYRRGYHEIPLHFDEMADRIMQESHCAVPDSAMETRWNPNESP